MPRVKGGPKTRQRRRKRLKLAKGQYGAKSRLFRSATESVDKGQTYPYAERRKRKRHFPSLWVARISAAVRPPARRPRSACSPASARALPDVSLRSDRRRDRWTRSVRPGRRGMSGG